jgi:hypothetical protein
MCNEEKGFPKKNYLAYWSAGILTKKKDLRRKNTST